MPSKFDSEFDPDELSRLTDKGLKPGQRSNDKPITHSAIRRVKAGDQSAQMPTVKARQAVSSIFGGIVSSIAGIFAPKTKKVVQCDNYGHRIRPGWKGEFPTCEDCGQLITSPDDIRKAMPKNSEDDEGNKGRKYVK